MLINITLVILLLIVFSYLNGKINNLENEIRALKKRNLIKEENIDSTLKVQEEKPLPESYLTFNNRKTEKIISDNIIQDYENKENSWIDEVLGFVKQNVLTIIGILTLVIGIGYFVKYAIDKNWIGETARFIIGMLTGFGIMAIGYFIQKNYKIFSSIISGGGIEIL